MAGYVLDTSALLAFIQREPGGEQVLEILGSRVDGELHEPTAAEASGEAPPVYLPFLSLMECDYQLRRRFGYYESERLLRMLRAWPVELVESSERWRREAARIKAEHSLSLADAWIAALALLRSARLVHRDPDYDAIAELESVRLPDG
ncbi:MAG TPA: PIN domain-containing protein [Thermoanaerobaculia bacterium]|nr:PIN domain-containing protein [Thermoanaerobaculia bacterium]